jgi:putative flavoprotein involved in K+ transport
VSVEKTDTLIVGAGQAGLAMSEHLGTADVAHLVLERDRIAERWRTARWDSLVMNGPAWHDRFPTRDFSDHEPDAFPGKDAVADYFEAFANQINAPVRCGVEVLEVSGLPDQSGFTIRTSQGALEARNVVAATGPFQVPVLPSMVPERQGLNQLHSSDYRNPQQLAEGAVLVIGAGSSGSQIADELLRAGRDVYLSIGAHDRPPRRYRGKDFVWWLNVLGKWQKKVVAGTQHVTIAVSGAYGGRTIDFRRFAARGMTLIGKTLNWENGVLAIAPDLRENLVRGDDNYLSLLDEADAYVTANGLDLPLEPDARIIGPDPDCVTDPILELDLAQRGITTIIWATGFVQDFSWLKLDTFDAEGRPDHVRGVARVPGLYFLGLPWLTMRGSSFIWGVWEDARYLARYIAERGPA